MAKDAWNYDGPGAYTHYTGRLYAVTGLRKCSDDGVRDGQHYVDYEDDHGNRYTTPLERFNEWVRDTAGYPRSMRRFTKVSFDE